MNITLCTAVAEIRSSDSRIGGLKLHHMLRDIFGRESMPGRDSFFRLLRRKGLMLEPTKGVRTTNSNHRYRTYTNRIKEFVPDAPNQLWVSDITYIRLKDKVIYLHLVTDAYSHKVIGWCLSEGLYAIHTLHALNQAIEQSNNELFNGLIHHSDRGSQYCSDLYVKTLKEHGIAISMTQDSNPTDNAIAERVNGILKQGCPQINNLETIEQAESAIGTYIDFYNTKRPHMSIGMLTPDQAHTTTGELKRCWKSKVYPPKQPTSQNNTYL